LCSLFFLLSVLNSTIVPSRSERDIGLQIQSLRNIVSCGILERGGKAPCILRIA
jgi:hypothetical protein